MDGKRVKTSRLRALAEKLGSIPHLFAKCVIIHCVICGTLACAYALRIMSRTGQDPAALLGVILGFFGGELLLLCLRTVLQEKSTNKKQGEEPGKETEP